jgi:serine/threonine protein kinase
MPAPRSYRPGEVIGRNYKVVGPLGIGGSGVVYQVKRKGEVFAAKVYRYATEEQRPEEKAQFSYRLRREFRILKSLDHPNIVRVHHLGWHDGLPYYVMDLIKGVPLLVLLQTPEIPLSEVVELYSQLAGAVAYLHELGICHRDIKPGNVLVDEKGKAVLHDFGLCKPPRATPLTGADGLVGTIDYISPEYAAHLLRRGRTPFDFSLTHDVHAMGVTLYQMLTGKLPFWGVATAATGYSELLRQIKAQVPQHPSDVESAIPRPVGDLVMWMLEKDPRRRPADGRVVRSEILKLMSAHEAELKEAVPRRRVSGRRRVSSVSDRQSRERASRAPEKAPAGRESSSPPRQRWAWVAVAVVVAVVLTLLTSVVGANVVLARSNGRLADNTERLVQVVEDLVARRSAQPPAGIPPVLQITGAKMPEKPDDPRWLRPTHEGRCVYENTDQPLVAVILRGICWSVAVKRNPKKPCPDGWFDAPPEAPPDSKNDCFRPYEGPKPKAVDFESETK